MNPLDRILALQEGVKASRTPKQLQWRERIYEKIVGYITDSQGDDEVFKKLLWGDYLAWAAWYLNGEEHPLFLTKKQFMMYVRFFEKDSNIWMYQRRAGKSVGTAVLVLYYALTHPNKNVLTFAPTEAQLFLMPSIRTFLGQDSAEQIFTEFLGENVRRGNATVEDDTNKVGTVFNQKYIRFSNGSDITAVTLNVTSGGSTKRGFSANIIVVDEFQDVPSSIREEIIEPIIMDAFSDEKKIVYIGTPHRKIDVKLDEFWESAKKNPLEGTLHSHCWDAVEEGIRKPGIMATRFRKLHIPCKWVLKAGICPIFLPAMYEEATGEVIERNDKGFGKVDCGKVCMENDTFVQEDMAMFPNEYGIGIPKEWIYRAGMPIQLPKTDYELYQYRSSKTIMGIDWGDVHADTSICIFQVKTRSMEGVSQEYLELIWSEVVNDPHVVGKKNPSATRIKQLYKMLECSHIFVDTTGKKEQVMELIMEMNDGEPPISKTVFPTNKGAETNAAIGQWSSGQWKDTVMKNMKEQLRLNRILVPDEEQNLVFWDQFYNEILGLRPEPATETRPYAKWGETLHLTDAIALAAMYLGEDFIMPASFEFAAVSIESNDIDEDGGFAGFAFL